ncbi:MAG: hypothetical protein CSA65_07680 [Proteobacteria bacterium]|nr:MAG: hypothetical protein CSA65_07680 [Pseudomonadota bacterium]
MVKASFDTHSLTLLVSALLLIVGVVTACDDDGAPAPQDAALHDGERDDATTDADEAPLGDGAHDGDTDLAPADDGGGSVPACIPAQASGAELAYEVSGPSGKATVTASGAGCEKTYILASTAKRKDDLPTSPRRVSEKPGQPTVRSNNRMFDALYALAIEEVRENAVASISDGAFNNGKALPCPSGGCFETGRKWTYVWTRDTAYAVALGLAALDPTRSRNSLAFKTSELRGGGGRQVVQDTGTGGSYPISSDRVVWAMGAWELLKYLSGSERAQFLDLAYDALKNTVEHDRKVVYDPYDGLYRGEQSFLDWREQTYPAWVKGDPVHIGMSKALSTNVGHLRALQITAALATEKGQSAAATQYQGWADALKTALRAKLWLTDLKMYSTFITTALDPAPVRHFDLLGSALAVTSGLAAQQQASEIVSRYPHLPHGPPVIWPQQKDVPIYHNRGIWPFVTAFWLRAAKRVGNAEAIDHNVRSLIRAAALNLSNMENLELVSGDPEHQDGAYSGPVVNSQRQLWSVAAYLSMVHDIIFGISAEQQGLRVAPMITARARHELFAATESVVLNSFPYRGKSISVVVTLPPPATPAPAGAYRVKALRLNGKALAADALITTAMLQAPRNLIEVELDTMTDSGESITLVTNTADDKDLFAPKPPTISDITLAGGKLQLAIDRNGETASEIAFNIYRDGQQVASGLAGGLTSWTDPATSSSSPSHCYALESYFVGSGNHSQHSRPFCFWGVSGQRVSSVDATAFTATGGTPVVNHGRFHYESWGDAGHKLVVNSFMATSTGPHLLQVVAGNGAGPENTGVTCAVKRLVVEDATSGAKVAEGFLTMPHLGKWSEWRDSNVVRATLKSGKSYHITIESAADALNMSSFAHFANYTGGEGGSGGAFNRVNIAQLKILALQ